MKKTSRRVSLLLVAAMVLGLLAALPAMTASAADTNYAKDIVPTVMKDEKGSPVAVTPDSAGKDLKVITDGKKDEDGEVLYYFGSSNIYYVVFDLGSSKSDISSVYLFMRHTGNRQFPNPVEVSVSADNSNWSKVATVADPLDTSVEKWAQRVYHFTSAQTGRYVKLDLYAAEYVTSFGEIEIRNYGLQTGPVSSEATDDPTLVNGNYAYQASYTVIMNDGDPKYRNAAQTDTGSMLTDGYESPSPSNVGVNGYTVSYQGTNANVAIQLNLKASHSDIGCVRLVNVPTPMTGGSFADPSNVHIGVSSDGLSYADVGALTSSTEDKGDGVARDMIFTFGAKSGKYVQVKFEMPAFLCGFDEIVVGAGSGSGVTDPDPVITCPTDVVTSTAETNYALASKGAYYAYANVFPDNASYLDDSWTRTQGKLNKFGRGELNDGVFAAGSYDDAKWVGFTFSATASATVDIVFDLAHLYGDIDQICFATLVHGNDLESYDKVENLTVSFGDINGSYGAAASVAGNVTEEKLNVGDKVFSRYTSKFGVAGPASGARYVKLSIPKATYRLFVDEIQILGHSGAAPSSSAEPPASSAAPVSSEAPASSAEPGSFPGSCEDRGTFDPNASYVMEPQFRTALTAEYGTFDADKNAATGTDGKEFTGIAVTVSIVDIVYPTGIFSLEGHMNFDNTHLTPLYPWDTDLNNGTDDAVYNTPKPILKWPTVDVNLMGTVYSVPNVMGLCKSYSMPDGSLSNPDEPEQTFSKPCSLIDFKYCFHPDYFAGYDADSDHIGLLHDNEAQLRYYFIVDEGQEGQTFSFQIPDNPAATQVTDFGVFTFGYDPEHGSGPMYYWNQPGKGGECSVTIPAAPVTHKVTFKDWNGTVLKDETVNDGENATPPADPAREGYTFTGWEGNYTNVQKDETVTAKYTENAAPAEFFTFKAGVDVTYIVKDEANGYLIVRDGLKTADQFAAMFEDPAITAVNGTTPVTGAENVTTGHVITSTIGGQSKSMTVVIVGEVNGDGVISSTDYKKVKTHVKGGAVLTGANFVAANATDPVNPTLSSGDYKSIKAFVKGGKAHF